MATILLTTIGTGGDVFPFVEIGDALSKRGHDVTLICQSHYACPIRSRGLNFIPIDRPEDSDHMMRNLSLLNTPRGLLRFTAEYILPRVSAELDILLSMIKAEKTLIIARAIPGFGARIAADLKYVPVLETFMSPANVAGLPVFYHLVQIHLLSELNDLRRRYGLRSIDEWALDSEFTHQIGLWPDWFCSPAIASSAITQVGFVLADDVRGSSNGCQGSDHIDPTRPLVVVSAGTGFFATNGFFESAIEGCQVAACQPLIVSKDRSLVPSKTPNGCLVTERVDWNSIMPRAAALYHHGGIGVLGQAMAAAVPQLVVAQGGDRPENGRQLQRLGVGEFISMTNRSPSNIGQALRRIIGSDTVRARCDELGRLVTRKPALPQICDFAESILNGSVVR